MELDRNGLEVLDRPNCLALLQHAVVGRIAFHSRALPAVLPVNFAMDGEDIVVRTGAGGKLDAATRGTVVAFEADVIDPRYHAGWSVVVTGIASEITDPAELARVRRLPLAHWAPDGAQRFIRISSELITGRRIVPPVHDCPVGSLPS